MVRVMWVLNQPLCHSVLMGYDLDNSLQLKSNAWSILDIKCLRILADVKINGNEKIHAYTRHLDQAENLRKVSKFAKCKDLDELNKEAGRIEIEMKELAIDLSDIKNIILVLSSGTMYASSSSSENRSSDNSHTTVALDQQQANGNAVAVLSLKADDDIERNSKDALAEARPL